MKRLFCAVAALTLVLLCAACSPRFLSAQGEDAPGPASGSGAQHPVTVTESYADVDTVAPGTPTPTANAEATPVPTPQTGEVPVTAFAGAAGLILICSAGLLMLRRI